MACESMGARVDRKPVSPTWPAWRRPLANGSCVGNHNAAIKTVSPAHRQGSAGTIEVPILRDEAQQLGPLRAVPGWEGSG